MTDYKDIMNAMAQAVSQAVTIVQDDFQRNLQNRSVDSMDKDNRSGLPDYVTETDKNAEAAIRASLANSCAHIPFVGEESGGDLGQPEFFLVDPLDGTSNFIALRDYFAVCAAYVKDGEVKAAVIADPCRNTLVKAYVGGGSFLQTGLSEKRLDISAATNISRMQLECEMPIKGLTDVVQTTSRGAINPVSFVSKLMNEVSGFRKSGSTALDLMNLVQGRQTIVISSNLAPHDIAAGVLIVKEAGGVITDLAGQPARFDTDAILSSGPAAHKVALGLI